MKVMSCKKSKRIYIVKEMYGCTVVVWHGFMALLRLAYWMSDAFFSNLVFSSYSYHTALFDSWRGVQREEKRA